MQRKIRLLNLPLIVALRAQNFVFNQLLRNRAAAGGIAVSKHLQRRREQSFEVNAGMLVKAHVLYGDKSVFQHIRDVLQIGPIAVFHIGDGRNQLAVHVIEKGRSVGNRQLRNVNFRCCFDVCFSDSEHQTKSRKGDHNKRKNKQFERCKQNRKRKRPRRLMLLKQRLFFHRGGVLLFCRSRFVNNQLPAQFGKKTTDICHSYRPLLIYLGSIPYSIRLVWDSQKNSYFCTVSKFLSKSALQMPADTL